MHTVSNCFEKTILSSDFLNWRKNRDINSQYVLTDICSFKNLVCIWYSLIWPCQIILAWQNAQPKVKLLCSNFVCSIVRKQVPFVGIKTGRNLYLRKRRKLRFSLPSMNVRALYRLWKIMQAQSLDRVLPFTKGAGLGYKKSTIRGTGVIFLPQNLPIKKPHVFPGEENVRQSISAIALQGPSLPTACGQSRHR